jgi:hypothetical protein
MHLRFSCEVVLVSERNNFRKSNSLFFLFGPIFAAEVVVAAAAQPLLMSVFWVGFLVWVVFWGWRSCCCSCEPTTSMQKSLGCCLVVGCWNKRTSWMPIVVLFVLAFSVLLLSLLS